MNAHLKYAFKMVKIEPDFTDRTVLGVGLQIYKVSCEFIYLFCSEKKKIPKPIFLLFMYQFYKTESEIST